jgi:hypothetical protein
MHISSLDSWQPPEADTLVATEVPAAGDINETTGAQQAPHR